MDCTNVRNLAVSLAEEGDRATDEWEKRAEVNLSQFVVSGIEQQWIDGASTVCNDKGCLMYVTIIVGAGANDFDSFVQSLLGQSWAREFRVVTDARTRSARPFSIYPPPLRTAISRRHASYLFIFLKPDTSLSEAGDRST